ncbi:SynChlorMet cassette protein ScmC [Candidatus Fermentibacteria bacterium]|nr:SynChlorMet cassette protein ScmC [Candidatus Fermentibacteria bacterium]
MPIQTDSGSIPGAVFFAAYAGPSMNPTLREPEIMEILPYDTRPLRVGDVVLFLSPEAHQPVVHRIVRVTPAGISTLGDNNTHQDEPLLHPRSIKGQVVAAWRGQRRRKIAGGLRGRLTGRWLRCLLVLRRGASPLLYPLYHALSRGGLIAWLVPDRFRPRVVVFHAQGRDQFQLLLGRRVIGRYDDYRHRWQIQRPFHVLVGGRALPRQQDKTRLSRRVSIERRRTVGHPPTREVWHSLALADGSHWTIAAGDEEAASIVAQLGCAMQLPKTTGETEPFQHSNPCRLVVTVDAHTSVADCYVPLASGNDGVVACILSPCDSWGGPYVNLVRLSLIFAREAQARGGVLIHGALAERDGNGVILVGPGGTGKTTASNRLPAPWRSLCDDTTLVVRDPHGNYQAHPWPTWSRFQDGGPGGTWDVQNAVPLKGIFILAQAVEDRVEQVGPGQAVSLLVEGVRQASMFMPLGLFRDEVRTLYLEAFNNLCALARIVPAHMLHISLTGPFWQEIERAPKGDTRAETQETSVKNQPESKLRSVESGSG